MTKDQVEAMLAKVRSWPPSRQEDAVRVLLAMEAESVSDYALSADERADLLTALDEAARGDLASDSEVEALFSRLRG